MPALAKSVSELVQTASVRACLDWFRKERAWINEQHLALCRVPAPTFFEQKRAEWMAERFRALGWESKLDRAGNVIASLPGYRDRPAIAVTAHLDTVLAPKSAEDIKVAGDGRFLGPGVSDNGTGLSALLALAAAWAAFPPMEDTLFTPVLIANVGEEGEGNLCGMRYLCRPATSSRFRAFLVLDGPNTDRITCRALGSRRFEVNFTGPGGHSWSDYGTGNPVHALCRSVAYFSDQAMNGGPRSSFNFGVVEGGTSINAIPNEARTKVDLRSESLERMDQMAALLASAVEKALDEENARADSAGRGSAGRVSARLKEIGSRPGGKLPEGSAMLETLLAVDAHLGIRGSLDCSSTDANLPLSLGLPALSIGAGGQGGGAHTLAEWYQPEGRDLGLRRILLVLCLLCDDMQ
jgi:acetylornithine deacetylase/succinyl-diaminopimelate desuccinylase-like protein